MQSVWCWISANAGAITALAAALAAVFTGLYFIYTVKIFRETKKSAAAAERGVKFGEDNARAAKDAASAAGASASAAHESLGMMRQQSAEQYKADRSTVQTTIDSAVASITHWKSLHIQGLPIGQIPDAGDLIPLTADSALESARRLRPDIASKLSSAFDDLRNARRELEIIRSGQHRHVHASAFRPACDNFDSFLSSALAKLIELRKLFP